MRCVCIKRVKEDASALIAGVAPFIDSFACGVVPHLHADVAVRAHSDSIIPFGFLIKKNGHTVGHLNEVPTPNNRLFGKANLNRKWVAHA